jgi:amino acid transporter
MGPWLGWLGGWAIIVADVIVMANLSQIAGIYSFLLFGADSYAASTFWVTLVGVAWIVVMTAICYIGVELSAKTQWYLLAAEIIALAIFAVVALWKVYVDSPAGRSSPHSPGSTRSTSTAPVHSRPACWLPSLSTGAGTAP